MWTPPAKCSTCVHSTRKVRKQLAVINVQTAYILTFCFHTRLDRVFNYDQTRVRIISLFSNFSRSLCPSTGKVHDYTFRCLAGTVFDQETRVCERADEVDCSRSESFFYLNNDLYGPGIIPSTA